MVKNHNGVALIIVLWVVTLLIVLTFAFSVMVRTEVFSTMTFKERMENRYLAEAGMNRAILEIFYRNDNKAGATIADETGVCMVDGSFYEAKMTDGFYKYAVTDEAGKININLLTDKTALLLNNLLVNLGVDKAQADIICDSILDWKDADDLHRLQGAETEYYMSLPEPYKSKDANFDNLEELLLVRGMTRDILFGAEGKPPLINYLTVYSSSQAININTASPDVLRAIPQMTEEMIQSILNYRKADNTKKDGSGLQSVLSTADYAKIASYVTTADSGIYTIASAGYKAPDSGRHAVKAVIRMEGADRYKILYYQSPAVIEIPKDESENKDPQ